MNKDQLIIEAKSIRVALDEVLQRMKAQRVVVPEGHADPGEVVANKTLSIRHVEDAIMRQGMVLKVLENPNPYPNSYNPSNTKVEPTADNLKL